jgi:hypothetical protein
VQANATTMRCSSLSLLIFSLCFEIYEICDKRKLTPSTASSRKSEAESADLMMVMMV